MISANHDVTLPSTKVMVGKQWILHLILRFANEYINPLILQKLVTDPPVAGFQLEPDVWEARCIAGDDSVHQSMFRIHPGANRQVAHLQALSPLDQIGQIL